MELPDREPVHIDREGKAYYYGTPQYPYNFREMPIVFMSLDEERRRMDSSYGERGELYMRALEQKRNLAAYTIEKARNKI